MKNPILVLVSLVICSITAPIIITAVSYDDNDIKNNGEIHIVKKDETDNLKINNSEVKGQKELNLETVDKESPKISIYNHNIGKYQKIDLEEYLCGVLAGEMSPEFDLEALKAQAVAARTYVMYKLDRPYPSKHKNGVVCTDYRHCQEYKSYDALKKINGDDWMKNSYSKIQEAVKSTKGQIVVYEDKAILPLYFSTSSGKTENCSEVFSADYPYLTTVDSPYDTISPKFVSNMSFSKNDFINKLKRLNSSVSVDVNKLSNQIGETKNSSGGAVDSILIGNKSFKGTDMRTAFGLNSANFRISIDGDKVFFNVKGYGHGVGMSQWGAEGMAKDGSRYYEILSHYYSKTSIKDVY